MKAVIYARVSTEDQNTENQIPALEALAKQRGWEIVGIYQEEASAWKNGHQKELALLFEYARKGNCQILLVWSLDRLTREGPLKILQYYKKLSDYGVDVVSLQDSWTEMPSEVKPLLLAVMGWVAELESKRRSERTKAGLARVRAAGQTLGRPRKGSVREAHISVAKK